MLKQMYGLLIVFFVSIVLFSSCEKDSPLIEPPPIHYYLFNNSTKTVHLLSYGDCPIEEIIISAGELINVGIDYAVGGNDLHPFFDADRINIYSDKTLIYSCEKDADIFHPLFNYKELHVEYWEHGPLFVISVFPLFKWCGNRLCEDQCGAVSLEEK